MVKTISKKFLKTISKTIVGMMTGFICFFGLFSMQVSAGETYKLTDIKYEASADSTPVQGINIKAGSVIELCQDLRSENLKVNYSDFLGASCDYVRGADGNYQIIVEDYDTVYAKRGPSSTMAVIPPGKKFDGWSLLHMGCVFESGPVGMHIGEPFLVANIVDIDDGKQETDDGKQETENKGDSQVQQAKYVAETTEERALREWKISKNNPDNYLTKIYDAEGKKLVSALPTINNVKGGPNLIVRGTLEEAEKAFEKQKSENQIVVTMQENYCGPEFRKIFEAEAAKVNGSLSEFYDIKAEERTKKDNTFVRGIHNITEEVTYTILLPSKVVKASEEGKKISIIWYKEDGTMEIITDLDTDKTTFTFKTKYPSGTFTYMMQ